MKLSEIIECVLQRHGPMENRNALRDDLVATMERVAIDPHADDESAGDPPTLAELKADVQKKIRAAEQAAYKYACECDVGRDRERAFDVYENVRTAMRVGP